MCSLTQLRMMTHWRQLACGSAAVSGESRGPVADGAALGEALAEDLLSRAGPGFFAA